MKAFVHPPRSSTIVQRKDGSTVRKEWLYFRTALVLEGESKAWSTLLGVKSRTDQKSARTVERSDSVSPSKPDNSVKL